MVGNSSKEQASKGLYGDISGFDPNVKNRFDNAGVLPFNPSSLVPAFNRATDKGVSTLKRMSGENVKTAQQSTTAGLQSRGYGGSILEDAIAKSRARTSGQGTNAIQQFLTNRAGQLPGVMNQANQTGLRLTGAQQGVDFQNILNMFRKFGSQQGSIKGLSDTTTFDDILALGKTAAQIAAAFA